MELAELVERIQRWKQRNDAEQAGQENAYESHSDYNKNPGFAERAQPLESGETHAPDQFADGSDSGREVTQEVDNDQMVEEEIEVDADQIVAESDENRVTNEED